MKHLSMRLFLVLCLFCIAFLFSGCTITFTQNDTLQLSLSEPTEQAMTIVAEFEAGEAENAAGDVTQQAGSVCAGGACIIY